jgi:predicted DNA-binding protein (MmcQ/YjbR family)
MVLLVQTTFIIIFDQKKINEELITNYVNNTHKYLEFKLTKEKKHNLLGPLHPCEQ